VYCVEMKKSDIFKKKQNVSFLRYPPKPVSGLTKAKLLLG